MSTKISRDFGFASAIHFENIFIINSYLIDLSIDVRTEDIREQNIALDRIKYFIYECLSNCIFIEHTETKMIDLYLKAGLKVCPLPEEPYDQIVGSVLLLKCNAITENKIFVTDIKIKSSICDDVVFYISEEEASTINVTPNIWFNDNSPLISDYKKTRKEKVVELKKENPDWNSVGLSWKEKNKSRDKGEIVFIKTDK